ncbi:MAG: dolichyl-phosphate beta-glucosyltransferase [Candidatus Peribacteraceae bacterium]
MKLSIIIPAYNEERRLPRVLEAIEAYFRNQGIVELKEVFVVDDGSEDRTAAVAESFEKRLPIHVLRFPLNRGKGAVTRDGMLSATGEWRLMYDADGATPIREIEHFARLLQEDPVPVMIGSRVLGREHAVVSMSWHRRFIGRVYHGLCAGLAPGIKDAACGFKLFRADAAQQLFSLQTIDRFAFDVEILALAHELGMKVQEVPVHWDAIPGSKVNLVTDTVQMAGAVMGLYFKKLFGGNVR